MDAYHVVEEDGSMSVAVVRDGELSRMTTLLFTTHQDTALGMYVCMPQQLGENYNADIYTIPNIQNLINKRCMLIFTLCIQLGKTSVK